VVGGDELHNMHFFCKLGVQATTIFGLVSFWAKACTNFCRCQRCRHAWTSIAPLPRGVIEEPIYLLVVYVSDSLGENLRLGLVKTGVNVAFPLGHHLGRSICHVLMLACLALHLHRRPGVCVALWLVWMSERQLWFCLCGLGCRLG
jgi:hypothetical protein